MWTYVQHTPPFELLLQCRVFLQRPEQSTKQRPQHGKHTVNAKCSAVDCQQVMHCCRLSAGCTQVCPSAACACCLRLLPAPAACACRLLLLCQLYVLSPSEDIPLWVNKEINRERLRKQARALVKQHTTWHMLLLSEWLAYLLLGCCICCSLRQTADALILHVLLR